MKTSLRLLFAVALALTLSSSTGVAASKKKKKEPERQYTTISSVTADSITISENKITKTFPITQFTEILVEGQKSTVAALQPGMLVTITLGSDGVRAARINAGDPPPK
ncbi:MAG: hypothetical protein ACR2NX_10810 [Chthoniobacterales bacterium]